MNDLLCTVEDIAAICELKPLQVKRVVIKQPGFPVPSPISTPRKPRWVRAEVVKYLRGKPTPSPQSKLETA